MVECTKEMLESLKNATLECDKNEVEIREYFTKLTADIISRTEFGTSYKKGKQIFFLLTQLQALCAQASRQLCLPGSRYGIFSDF
jgi:cytokinin trans-hydroxylase